MQSRLQHHQIHQLLTSLSDSKIVNLDASLRAMLDPVAQSLAKGGGGEVSLHVLCCNEYFLVTGLTDQVPVGDIRSIRDSIQSALGPASAGRI